MIARPPAMPGNEFSTMLIRELLNMPFDGQPMISCCFEYAIALHGRERDRFAEYIDSLGKPFACNNWYHLLNDQFNVIVGFSEILRWNCVSSKKRRGNLHGEKFRKPVSNPEHFQFIGNRQTIP